MEGENSLENARKKSRVIGQLSRRRGGDASAEAWDSGGQGGAGAWRRGEQSGGREGPPGEASRQESVEEPVIKKGKEGTGFAELSFNTEFRVQNLKGGKWKLLTLLNLISCMTKL